IRDIVADGNFSRAAIASEVGLHGAIGLPVDLGDGKKMVMEFFSTEKRVVGQDMLDLMNSIGRQIGQFISRANAEEEVRQINSRLKRALSGSAEGIWEWIVDTDQVWYSREFRDLLGYTQKEFSDQLSSFDRLIHPDDHDRLWTKLKQHLELNLPYDHDFRLRVKSGEYRWFNAKGQVENFEQGRKMPGTIRDITTRIEAEENFRAVVEGAPVGMVMVDQSGDIILVNAKMKEMFGYDRDELIGSKIEKLVPDGSRDKHQEYRETYFLDPVSRAMGANQDLLGVRKDGSEFSVEIGLNPIMREKGVFALASVIDITERKLSEIALRNAQAQAEESAKFKQSFLANMSHEIRTPINGVIGMTTVLLDTELNDRQRHYVEIIKESGDSLLGIINDVLDLSKIEAGKLELESVTFELGSAVESVARVLAKQATDKGIRLICHVDPDIKCHVFGDPFRIKQILMNLGGNAVKFTESGHVLVSARLLKKKGIFYHIALSVEDTGIGITDDQKKRLFREFSQADKKVATKFGGTGLGLSISQKIASMMNSEIFVESTIGKGSKFSMELTLTAQEQKGLAIRSLLKSFRVLICHSDSTVVSMLVDYIKSWNLKVEAVSSLAEVATKLNDNAEPTLRYDVVILSRSMRDQDSLQFVRSIMGKSTDDDPAFVLLMDYRAQESDERAAQAGFSQTLFLP
ncbi:MAG: PAS domain S-box protein, partial [Candidatus Obscuribacterales bacterium]|nr:PAS domain S-box protein [Candidatus Obscuribacterales bacterium]